MLAPLNAVEQGAYKQTASPSFHSWSEGTQQNQHHTERIHARQRVQEPGRRNDNAEAAQFEHVPGVGVNPFGGGGRSSSHGITPIADLGIHL